MNSSKFVHPSPSLVFCWPRWASLGLKPGLNSQLSSTRLLSVICIGRSGIRVPASLRRCLDRLKNSAAAIHHALLRRAGRQHRGRAWSPRPWRPGTSSAPSPGPGSYAPGVLGNGVAHDQGAVLAGRQHDASSGPVGILPDRFCCSCLFTNSPNSLCDSRKNERDGSGSRCQSPLPPWSCSCRPRWRECAFPGHRS